MERKELRLLVAVASLVVVTFFVDSSSGEEDASASTGTLPILIVDGQNNHDWKTTTPAIRRALESSGRFTVDVATAPATGSPMDGFRPPFKSYRAVLSNYNGDSWSAQTQLDLIEYVRSGGGFVVVHAANNAFPAWPEFNELIGLGGWGGRDERSGPYLVLEAGQWKRDFSPGIGGAHGPQYAFPVLIRDTEHAITRGMPREWLHVQDELYSHLRGPTREITVLATSFSDPGKRGSGRHEPVLFTLEFGQGRVFHTPLGHAEYSLNCVGFITALQRGTEWAAINRVTLPIPDDFPTAQQTRSRGDSSINHRIRPPLPAWPELPLPATAAKDTVSGNQAGDERTFACNGKFCWCPEGSYQMGSPVQEELFQGDESVRIVTFSSGFWLARHEVTRAVWREVMQTNPWPQEQKISDRIDSDPIHDSRPATHVSWDDATEFCLKLTESERKAGRLPEDWTYQLPTEAEWEYACRAGSQSRFSCGDREEDLLDYAWFAANTVDLGQNHPQPVGRKRANAWGLCDMHGNVWEWCLDSYDSMKSYRGGCWSNIAWWCRSADRNALPQKQSNHMLGFRVALVRIAADSAE